MLKKNVLKAGLLSCAVLVLIFSCSNENATAQKTGSQGEVKPTVSIENPISLVGKTLEYNYGEYIYQLQFKTDKDLHWKCVQGDEKGKEADETYMTQKLNEHTYFISWVEADGLGVSQVVNLKDKVVHCYLKIEKDIIPLSGTIREL